MVNMVEAVQKTLGPGIMKLAGLKPITLEAEPGTKMKLWVPWKPIKNPKKPVVVLVHGFAGDGFSTWQFQVGALRNKYSVYVPDLLFFGGSITDSKDRSPSFQAECIVKCLRKLNIAKCIVVGFSYGGVVAFRMAEKFTDMIQALVISGSTVDIGEWVKEPNLERLGFSSLPDLLLPTSVQDLKTLLSHAFYKSIWLPNWFYRDYFEAMFTHRRERSELLEALVISKPEKTIPDCIKIHLLWGQEDEMFNVEVADSLRENLGGRASMKSIQKGGHLVHQERPWEYTKQLKIFLVSLQLENEHK